MEGDDVGPEIGEAAAALAEYRGLDDFTIASTPNQPRRRRPIGEVAPDHRSEHSANPKGDLAPPNRPAPDPGLPTLECNLQAGCATCALREAPDDTGERCTTVCLSSTCATGGGCRETCF
jgi:hypothetical protein